MKTTITTNLCPICNQTTSPQFRPFCSKGCSDIDLNRWLNGAYAINDKGEITHNTDIHEDDITPKTDDE